VAGVAAARGGNGIGVTGAAPYAGLAGLRIDFPNQTTAMFVDATKYHSDGANTSIKVKNHSYGIPAPYIASTAQRDALAISASAGTIHVFAAGNEGSDANTKMLQNSPDAISVAALGSDGIFAGYSNFGACVFVTAPSSGGPFAITTTDRTGSFGYNGFPAGHDAYTNAFGGTSSASPLVAGVIALGKQVQPGLNTRFAKHLLARTSRVVDPNDTTIWSDGGWKTNAVGLKFNQNYGFGLIDADAFTQLAAQSTGVTPLVTEATGTVNVNAAIPDNDTTGVSRTFTISGTTPLEEMLVTLNVTHTWRGDVEAYLTSPSGTISRLVLSSFFDSGANIAWTFTKNVFWGENPAGTWTLNVRDVLSSFDGIWNSFAVTARMGTLLQSSTLYVDKNYTGVELGTETQPFNTLQEALNAASSTGQTTIYVSPNHYPENPMITKNVIILRWGNSGTIRVGTLP
jgi:subtilisin-like proprotein convertase family protein